MQVLLGHKSRLSYQADFLAWGLWTRFRKSVNHHTHPPELCTNFCVHLCFSGEGSVEFLRCLKGLMMEGGEERTNEPGRRFHLGKINSEGSGHLCSPPCLAGS